MTNINIVTRDWSHWIEDYVCFYDTFICNGKAMKSLTQIGEFGPAMININKQKIRIYPPFGSLGKIG